MNPCQLWIFISTVFVFTTYLNLCTSYEEFETPKIWPNISDNHSFLQWPGLTGAGGLDFSLYDAFEAAANKSRLIPGLIAKFGDYTLLQLWLMIVVGAGAAGVATLLGESYLFKVQQDALDGSKHHASYGPPMSDYGTPSVSYGVESPGEYGAPSPQYGSPPPASSYGSPPTPTNSYGSPPNDIYGSPPVSDSSYGSLPSPTNSYESPPPPSSSYGSPPAPSSSYGSPMALSSSYGSPAAPTNSYGSPPSPSSSYGSPITPSNSYGSPPVPSTSYGSPPTPSDSYGSPAANTYDSSRSFKSYRIPTR